MSECEYKAIIKDGKLAKEIADATSQYQDQLIASLEYAKQVESTEDYKRLSLTFGHVLATLGQSILFPIYRRHPALTPDILKETLAKEAQRHNGSDGASPRQPT